MLKFCSLFLFNFPLSLSLSLSLALSYRHRSRHHTADLKLPSRSLSRSKCLPPSHFGLSTSLVTLSLSLSLSPFWLLVSVCGSTYCCSDGIQVLCFFFPPMVVSLFNFYRQLFFEMIFVVNLVGFGLQSWWPVDLGSEIIFYWVYGLQSKMNFIIC